MEKNMVRLELRLEADLARSIKKLAASSGMSVNQVMQGVARWAVDHAHAGMPVVSQDEELYTRKAVGVVWFGVEGKRGVGPEPHVVFAVDYSSGRVVREDWPSVASEDER
ncbi:MAG: hypothetical protein ABFD92_01980 [Planctomycetaceae bacterium]|nr:hypothetical protein [Planctomycetaceae bacterium]